MPISSLNFETKSLRSYLVKLDVIWKDAFEANMRLVHLQDELNDILYFETRFNTVLTKYIFSETFSSIVTICSLYRVTILIRIIIRPKLCKSNFGVEVYDCEGKT